MAIFASYALQIFRKVGGRARRPRRLRDDRPNAFAHLQTLNVLREVVQPPKQTERIANSGKRRRSDAGGDAQPRLLTQFRHDAVFDGLNRYRHCRLSARRRIGARADLHDDFVAFAQRMSAQIALIKFRNQRPRQIGGLKVSVKNFAFHRLDYNRFAILLL